MSTAGLNILGKYLPSQVESNTSIYSVVRAVMSSKVRMFVCGYSYTSMEELNKTVINMISEIFYCDFISFLDFL